MEKATTGLYLSGHPMDQYREEVEALHAPHYGFDPGGFRPGGRAHSLC